MTVLIAGAGIAGLSLGLTCHQIGVSFRIFEAVRAIRPLGVGINLQPNSVRELYDLGLAAQLAAIGIETQEYGFYTKFGLEIWNEPRGLHAGYRWPQYSVHRGRLQMMLYDALVERAGSQCIESGWRADGFENNAKGVTLNLISAHNGSTRQETGTLLVGADGIHSAVRAQIVPQERAPLWGGAVLWRSMTRAPPFRTGASMALIGHDKQRIVAYPISAADPETGLCDMNWIAELTYDPLDGWNKEDWNRAADRTDFAPQFADWCFDWLDCPALIESSSEVFEYPMVDRDPLPAWRDGAATLMGDAAHPTYPVGSNGASNAVLDARQIGAAFLAHGVSVDALEVHETEMRPRTERIVLANRSAGPDAVMQMIEDRCGGRFERIEDVASQEELAAHAAGYKAIAGTAIETLNASPSTIPEGARVSSA